MDTSRKLQAVNAELLVKTRKAFLPKSDLPEPLLKDGVCCLTLGQEACLRCRQRLDRSPEGSAEMLKESSRRLCGGLALF